LAGNLATIAVVIKPKMKNNAQTKYAELSKMADISFVADTILYVEKPIYYKRRYDTIPVMSVSPILPAIGYDK